MYAAIADTALDNTALYPDNDGVYSLAGNSKDGIYSLATGNSADDGEYSHLNRNIL